MRSRHKMWRNGRGGKWTARIVWFEDDESIRLNKETPDGAFNTFFKRPDEDSKAQAEWDAFKLKWKQDTPKQGK